MVKLVCQLDLIWDQLRETVPGSSVKAPPGRNNWGRKTPTGVDSSFWQKWPGVKEVQGITSAVVVSQLSCWAVQVLCRCCHLH